MRKTVNPNTIQANPDNPRTITEDKLNLLVKSLKEFPEMLEKRPIVVTTNEDGTFTALGGNMRARAAQQAGLESIEIDTADDWSEDKRKQFIIKDNASFGEWDWDTLGNEWDAEELIEWGIDVPGFDLNAGDYGEDFSLADGDKEPFQQMTFTLADEQAERIKEALKDVQVQDGTEYGNENSNGNALHQIVLEWAEQKTYA